MSEFWTCRRLLDMMVILGFMIHHILRINMSIAIVNMVDTKQSNDTHMHFDWDEKEKNNILAILAWGNMLSSPIGGRLAETFGTKIVLGVSMFICGLFTVLTPHACYLNYYMALALRFGVGLAVGFHWPSIPPMAAKWVGIAERSKFISYMVASSLGSAIGLPICGLIIANLGWPCVFYITGGVALVWTLFWFYLVYDSPNQHPRISGVEKQHLQNEIGLVNGQNKKMPLPVCQIFKSAPVWAVIVGNFSAMSTFALVFNEMPSYLQQVLNFNIKENGAYSSLPYFARYLTNVLFAALADYLVKTDKLSITAIRKCLTISGLLGTALLCLLQVFWGYNRVVSIINFTLAFVCVGFTGVGIFPNSLDLAPNFSGTIYGIVNFFGNISIILSTQIVAYFTYEKQDFEHWRYVFIFIIVMNLLGSIFYFVYGSGEQQKWNDCDIVKEEETKLKLNNCNNDETIKL